ncbi:hypothetical protein LTR70_001396 [Exophiala xenobiotica]|uniref:Dethiobiotin synthase n=1 Tax=Lithohypha guttulata TaxID=1690604 RepID=A0ABR0KM94_9EURO|nr:hypothetical protein LTR24_000849 [Lithohypha guttulata]KAK5328075.1 hypothetical protein LTR70_001396 [Exophiala xenobiotica]
MLWRDLKAWQIYGANTDVGKTIISTVLCKALARRAPTNGLLYLKPVSTGPDGEADDRHISRHASGVLSKCLKQYSKPLSPHLAAKIDEPNHQLNSRVGKLNAADRSLLQNVKDNLDAHQKDGGKYALLETAGGVLSPGPSGSVQADLYRPLRLPVVLVGDAKLGGIATTISAFESLHLRGYDVQSILLFDLPQWGNAEYLRDYFSHHEIATVCLPPPPEREADQQKDYDQLAAYYEKLSSSSEVGSTVDLIHQKHFSHLSKLTSMPAHAESIIWHPFRQYGLPQNVVAIDSAYEDHFEVYNQEMDALVKKAESSDTGLQPLQSMASSGPLLTPLFDASASWWTQGLGHGNPNLSLTAAHAAGRYGHVMFANAVHEPALDLCYNILSTLRNPRLSRVFFTDNGSTGMEVAVKMALRATAKRYGWDDHNGEIGIIGLKGSYHGDTIGVMNCSEPSPFNEKVDWYKPWGYWFSPPEVKLVKGQWRIQLPADDSMPREEGPTTLFPSLQAVFDFDARQEDAQFYADYIARTLTHLTHQQKRKFGALILEPLIMGAGGMIFVDPLFQRTLISSIRADPGIINHDHQARGAASGTADPVSWSGLPIIADEVFTGLYRLGRPSSSSFWNTSAGSGPEADISPDISCHAKLLTGGLLPLALTTASDSIFNTFISDSKADALLHGHSYTAHPIGCSVANKSLDVMRTISASAIHSNPNGGSIQPTTSPKPSSGLWDGYRQSWSSDPDSDVFSFFSPKTLSTISNHQLVNSCFAIGTVLALTLESATSGYNSTAAASLQARLLTTVDEQGRGVHSRILGDVIYFMTGLETSEPEVRNLERTILRALDGELAAQR